MNPLQPQPELNRTGSSESEAVGTDEVWLAPVSEAQQRLWFVHQLESESPAYNLGITLRLRGRVDHDRLERALNRIVARHETLRTTFSRRGEEVVQVIASDLHLPLGIIDMSLQGLEGRESAWRRVAAEEGARLFDLGRGPLIRATLLILVPSDCVLLLNLHHIVFDGWSESVFVAELAEFYAAESEGRASSLPELTIQYADIQAFEREQLQGRLESLLDYWKGALEGVPRWLELPTDHHRPPVQSAGGALESVEIPQELWQKAMAFSRSHDVTVFMTLLTAYAALLHRWSGQDDILIGSPSAGRERTEVAGLIGFFVNMIVLRSQAKDEPTFGTLLARVRQTCRGAYTHNDLPFDRLVEALKPIRTRDRHPIFQVMFAQDPKSPEVVVPDFTMEREVVHNGTAKCDLRLSVCEEVDRAMFHVEYSTDLFERETIAMLAQRYLRLLAAAVADPNRRLSQLPMTGDDEGMRLVERGKGSAADYPRDLSAATVFEAQVRRTPNAVAVTCDGQQLSYAELNRRANQVAHLLKAQGVGPDVLVGVALDRSLDLIIALLAVAKAGGAYLPLDLTHPRDRLAYLLADSGVPFVLTQRQVAGALPPVRLFCLDDRTLGISQLDDGDLPPQAGADDLAYVMYTSGSTGQPKGVAVPHRGVVRLVCGTDFVRWDDVHAILHMAPASFDASTFEVWGPLLNGARCVPISDRLVSLEVLERVLRSERIDCLWLTAALFNTVIDAKPGILTGVRQLLVGGEALSVAHVRRALAHLPETQLVNGYGPTESTTFACTYRIPRALDSQVASIPIGRPIANTQAYVLDRYGSLVPDGVAGELYLGGDGLARGYLGQPGLTAERFVPDTVSNMPSARLYRTGDLARWLSDGNLEFLGRADRQIKLRGFRIEPGEVEHALRALDSVRDAVVEIRNDADVSHLAAYVVPAGGTNPAGTDVREQLKRRLPEYMVPSEFVFLPALPLTANGKIDRSALPSAAETPSPGSRDGAFANEVEASLAEIWREVLGLPAVSATDNFFDLGGHSLLAITMFSRIYDRFGRSLPIGTLFERPTIRGLSALLPAVAPRASNSTLHLLSAGGNKPPLVLMHGVDGSLWDSMRVTKYLGNQRSVYGLQTVVTDASAEVTVESMAARCVTELREKVPNGPYHVAGFCAAAKTAIEVAQQLRAVGQQVGLVAVLDYGMVDEPLPRSIFGAVTDFLWNLPLWIVYDLLPVGPSRVLGRLRSRFRLARLAVQRRLGRQPADANPDIRDALGIWRYPADQVGVLTTIWKAFENYTVRPYGGRISLFRPRAERLLPPRRPPDLGWGTIATGGVDVIKVPGSHETMLEEGFVPAVAARLAEAAEQADVVGQLQARRSELTHS